MRYFELFFDSHIPNQWVLKEPVDERGQEIDLWQFSKGHRIDLQGLLRFPLARPGQALDFNLTTLAVPVIHGRVRPIFDHAGLQQEVQLFPAHVEGVEGQDEPYFVLNLLRVIRCIDDARCEEVQYWKPEDERPDKVGQYRAVYGLRVDPSRISEGSHIFRPWGWRSTLIVSERLKQAMEEEKVSGARFIEV